MSRGGSSSVGAADIDRMMERWRREPRPIGLPLPLVERTGPRREGAPVDVSALIPVRYLYEEHLEVQGRAVEWTDRAVLVEAVLVPGAEPRRVWVWAGAVRRQ